MKILLAQPMTYLFVHGGGHKNNRSLLNGLAARGHTCRALAYTLGHGDNRTYQELLDSLAAEGVAVAPLNSGMSFKRDGVEVHTASDYFHLCAQLIDEIREFQPTWTLVAEDLKCYLLEAALETSPTRVVYLSHSSSTLPFGPDSRAPDANKTKLFKRVAGIVTLGQYMRDYVRRWAGADSQVFYYPVYGCGPFPRLGDFDSGYVTIINPSDIKGVSVFLSLARQLPHVEFAAVPTWATLYSDILDLMQLPNVRLLPPSDNIEDILRQTKVLLVPSLWAEAFGLVVVEAMLRGVPVIASDTGGLPEVKLGVPYVLPVRKIEGYGEDNRAKVPEQELGPWVDALTGLLSSREQYERLSTESRRAALHFFNRVGVEPFEKYFEGLQPAGAESPRANAGVDAAGGEKANLAGQLSADKRALLALRLRKAQESKRGTGRV